MDKKNQISLQMKQKPKRKRISTNIAEKTNTQYNKKNEKQLTESLVVAILHLIKLLYLKKNKCQNK